MTVMLLAVRCQANYRRETHKSLDMAKKYIEKAGIKNFDAYHIPYDFTRVEMSFEDCKKILGRNLSIVDSILNNGQKWGNMMYIVVIKEKTDSFRLFFNIFKTVVIA